MTLNVLKSQIDTIRCYNKVYFIQNTRKFVIMIAKDPKNRSAYPYEFKVKALKMLAANDFNYSKTAKSMGISSYTMKKWHLNDGKDILEQKFINDAQVENLDRQIEDDNDVIISKVDRTLINMLDRLNSLAMDAKISAKDTVEAVRALAEIRGVASGAAQNGLPAGQNVYNVLMQNIHKKEE